MQKIININEFEELIESNEPFFLLKHSTTCPISAAAYDEYQSFMEDPASDKKGVYLAVQEARELSNHIAQVTNIRHESPQVIYFKEGKPDWNESHWKITKDQLLSVK
ncbi:bacillithiol system redox-active protein YtxJ [Domibacillus sp. A3M-37]|uniref:bacillithiol system redox-active protein YtxJ n=1 Tax=Domibacillus sp. A3M-37 TaxID=2962037 RepID=UPI0020B7019F|nr:bacillithiol system redox-active protein YtxJ [Domibacillus sp. A3M-37]MCP3762457.1 bacillithiol system redox-active protein YtxJ [Domibacillus sp. A3M-37]